MVDITSFPIVGEYKIIRLLKPASELSDLASEEEFILEHPEHLVAEVEKGVFAKWPGEQEFFGKTYTSETLTPIVNGELQGSVPEWYKKGEYTLYEGNEHRNYSIKGIMLYSPLSEETNEILNQSF